MEEFGAKTPPIQVESGSAEMLSYKEDFDIHTHMEYCSAQLKNFETDVSEEEEEINLREMVCLPEDITAKIGSTKRSLFESLKEAEMSKSKKEYQILTKKWGHVLSTRPTTRQHGNVNIMDKAIVYLQSKNVDIPDTFQDSNPEFVLRENLDTPSHEMEGNFSLRRDGGDTKSEEATDLDNSCPSLT
ncbi:hypothetical protein D1007_48596 [Hordeum vulgare]|nr:hypothetical protein D1007_59990 [Hordeum vulgare]KAE8778499.1 hypothetical protein D1007_48596 [Hordeum vulgare]